MDRTRIICWALLAVVIAAHVVNDVAWVAQDTAPARWDQSAHLVNSLKFYAIFKSGRPILPAFQKSDPKHAPLMPFLSGFICAVFGESRQTATAVNYAALVVLCLSVYGIGRRLAGPWCGLLAAYITMAMPAVFGLSRQFRIEFPVTAAAAAFLYCIMRGGRRSGVLMTALTAFVTAVGLLLRETFLLYVFGAAVVAFGYAAWCGVRGKGEERGEGIRAAVKIVVAFLAGGAIAFALWYGPNFKEWYAYGLSNVSGEMGAHFTMGIPLYLLIQVSATNLQYHAALFAAVLLVGWLIRSKSKRAESVASSGAPHPKANIAIILAGLLFTLLVCLASVGRTPHYFFPVLPFLGVVLAYLYVRYARGWGKAVAAAGLLFLIVPVWYLSWSEGPAGGEESTAYTAGSFFLGRQAVPLYGPPERGDWKTEEVVRLIDRDYREGDKYRDETINGVCLPSLAHFHGTWFKYLGLEMLLRGEIANACHIDAMPLPFDATDEWVADFISSQQYVVAKSGAQGDEWLTVNNARIMKTLEGAKYLFEPVATIKDLPDGSIATIYRNKFIRVRPEEESVKRAKQRFLEEYRRSG